MEDSFRKEFKIVERSTPSGTTENELTITHYVYREFREDCSSYKNDREMYERSQFVEINSAYSIAKKYNWLYDFKWDEKKEAVYISMPFYKNTLWDLAEAGNLPENILEKLVALLLDLIKKEINHTDIAFRNIGVDDQGELRWIDLDSLTYSEGYEELDLVYLEYDFEVYKLEGFDALKKKYILETNLAYK